MDILKHSCGPAAAASESCSAVCAFFGFDSAKPGWEDSSGGFLDVPDTVNWDTIQRSVEKSNRVC